MLRSSSYIAYVCPILDYMPLLFDCHTISIAIDLVQRKAARFVTNNYHGWNLNDTDRLQHLQWNNYNIDKITFVVSQCTKYLFN